MGLWGIDMNRIVKGKIKDFFKVLLICLFALSIPVMLGLYAMQAKKYTDLKEGGLWFVVSGGHDN